MVYTALLVLIAPAFSIAGLLRQAREFTEATTES